MLFDRKEETNMCECLTMGFVRSEKPYEKRIALLPQDIKRIQNASSLYFEIGYGEDFNIEDQEYIDVGCHVVDKKEVLKQNIICDTKIGEATYLSTIEDKTILLGWIHANANKQLTKTLLKKQHCCYAFEDMYHNNQHTFWKNNQIAGYGGVFNALQYTGFLPKGCKAAVIGRGDTGMGASNILNQLGAQVKVYNRQQEKLFVKDLPTMDIVVIAVRWDTLRTDYLISSLSRKTMKKDAIIIDISDDNDGAIENSISSTIKDPIYYLDGIKIYSVCNVPSIFYKTATLGISKSLAPYIDDLVTQTGNLVLHNSMIINNGQIIDQNITI